MSRGQRILNQMQSNQQEIVKLREGGVTAGEESRLRMLHRSQAYWAAEYKKATGKDLPQSSSKAEQSARVSKSVEATTRKTVPPNCLMDFEKKAIDPRQKAPQAVIVSLSGDVSVSRGGNRSPAYAGQLLFVSDNIWVRKGNASIRFLHGKGNTISLSPQSLMVIYSPPLSPWLRKPCTVPTKIDSKALQEGLRALRGSPAS